MKKVLFSLAAIFMAAAVQAQTYYVSKTTGNNRNNGLSAATPLKNLQKALDVAPDGAKILVAEGNYIGTLDCGNLFIKTAVTIEGGYSTDFNSRDIVKHQTTVFTNTKTNGTAKGQGTIDINVKAVGKKVTIDGLIMSQGNSISYNARHEGQPEGVESPMMNPVGGSGIGGPNMDEQSVKTNRMALIYFNNPMVDIDIVNCAFVNGSNYAILGMFQGVAHVKNNIFVNNVMASVDIRGSYGPYANKFSEVYFENNTVLFTWSRLKDFGDMGYGFCIKPGTNCYVSNNIFGFSIFAGLDRSHIDSNKAQEAKRITSVKNNLFCFNKQGDLVIPGGGMMQRVAAEEFEDVDALTEVENNNTLSDAKMFNGKLDPAYVNGFLSASYKESTDYNPNSSANQFRSAMGLNQVGTMQSSATMFANRYNVQKALQLFGAVKGYGAQIAR